MVSSDSDSAATPICDLRVVIDLTKQSFLINSTVSYCAGFTTLSFLICFYIIAARREIVSMYECTKRDQNNHKQQLFSEDDALTCRVMIFVDISLSISSRSLSIDASERDSTILLFLTFTD